MEHEDNSQLDNYLQNSQNLGENTQMPSGGEFGDHVRLGPGDGIVAGIGEITGSLGGKFEQHDEHDEEELKYVKEVHQSEKQRHTMETVDEGVGNGDVGELLGRHDIDVGNGDVNVAAVAAAAAGIVNEAEFEIIKNDGDFSTTSNTTSTPGEDVAADVLQVEMKIEQMQQEVDKENIVPPFGCGRDEEMEDEEPSSLTTNTNGTSSLSENSPHQPLSQQQQQQPSELIFDQVMEDKENADPLTVGIHDAFAAHDFETHSQLNPDAEEFVPHFGSNPTTPSPTAPHGADIFAVENVGEPADTMFAALQQPHPNALPHRLLAESDDLVAQSPRKGRGADMESILLPEENEFEREAAKRPHELEQEEDLIGDGALPQQQQQQQPQQQNLLLEQFDNGNGERDLMDTIADSPDFSRHSPMGLIDHGPETSVDIDGETGFNQSALKAHNDEHIELLLNTVQPIPNESDILNESFTEQTNEKELLNVEEKEHISHSPSTEEMQMNMRNEWHSSARDIPQIPIDLDSAAHMQDSFYLEHTSADSQQLWQQSADMEGLLGNTSNTLSLGDSLIGSHVPTAFHDEPSAVVASPRQLHFADEFTTHSQVAEDATPSPHTTEEKHLSEDTKEPTLTTEFIEQKMGDLFVSNDGNLPQVEDVDENATTINENPFWPRGTEEQRELATSQQQLMQPFEQIPTNEQNRVFNDQLLQQQEETTEAKAEPEVTVSSEAAGVAEAAAAVSAASVVAATAAVAVAASKKTEATKKSTATKTATPPVATKGKIGDTKKQATEARKPATKTSTGPMKPAPTTSAARPRTAPAKPSLAAERKVNATATTAAKPASAAARRPVSATTTAAARTSAPKPSATSTAAARPSTAARTNTGAVKTGVSTKPAATTRTSVGTAAPARKSPVANGPAGATKARLSTSAAPTKPTTLGLSQTTKPKLSPRATLTSQLRKAGPTAAAGATTAAKSPIKPTSTTNGVGGKSPTTTTTRNTTITTTTTKKTFTARPAPKTTTNAITTTTTRRTTSGGGGGATATAARPGSSSLRKTSPSKPITAAKLLLPSSRSGDPSPLKTTPKTKEAIPKKSPLSSSDALKQKQQAASPKTNGEASIAEEQQQPEQEQQLNGGGQPRENGTHVQFEQSSSDTLIDT